LNSFENDKIGSNLLDKILPDNLVSAFSRSTPYFIKEPQNWENISLLLDTLIPEGQLTFYSPSNLNYFLVN